jgi:hypothetical protein
MQDAGNFHSRAQTCGRLGRALTLPAVLGHVLDIAAGTEIPADALQDNHLDSRVAASRAAHDYLGGAP